MKKLLPSLVLASLLLNSESSAQATSPYQNRPDVNIAVARAGMNGDATNPYFLYDVNQSNGAMTLVPGGPFKEPTDQTKNLQVNAVGVSKKDGYIYGLSHEGTITTQKLVRMDNKYGITNLGYIPSPVSAVGTVGIVNNASGDMDTAGNYYFTALTVNPFSAPPSIDKFFIGKIGRTDTITAAPVLVTYYEIEMGSTECANFIASLSTDPSNSGLKDFAYNSGTNSFFAWATYKPTSTATNFTGQLLEIKAIAGSNPMKYEVICNPTLSTHAAETAGTLIDKWGKLTVLMTDGSFGTATRNIEGIYTGSFSPITPSTGLPNPLRADMGSAGQQTYPELPEEPLNCPDASIAVLREGFNADTLNPTYIYRINTSNGTFTQLPGGPLAYPGNPSKPLHVNGVGVNKFDGFIYGVANDFTTASAKFVRFDYKYGVQFVGTITPPVSPTGPLGVVNTAAGDVDRNNNYLFTAFTASVDPTSGLPVLDKVYIGKIPNINTAAGTLTPEYTEVQLLDPNCAAWLNSITTDPNNSGLKDLVVSPFVNTIYSYATYKPAGSPNYVGQLVEFKPVIGSPARYQLSCNPVVNQHTAETSGTLIDENGNFLVLMTDGTVGKLPTTGSILNYNGTYATLNGATSLPSVIRGDLASCAEVGGPTPVTLVSFNATDKDCRTSFNWIAENEVDFKHYEILQSFDNINFSPVAVVAAKRGNNRNNYSYTISSAGKQASYRLKMVDNTGRFTLSNVINVNTSCKNVDPGFVITPNPVQKTLNLNWFGIKMTTNGNIRVFDAYGKQVINTNIALTLGNPISRIDVNHLPPGTYFIKAVDNFSVYEQSFIKK